MTTPATKHCKNSVEILTVWNPKKCQRTKSFNVLQDDWTLMPQFFLHSLRTRNSLFSAIFDSCFWRSTRIQTGNVKHDTTTDHFSHFSTFCETCLVLRIHENVSSHFYIFGFFAVHKSQRGSWNVLRLRQTSNGSNRSLAHFIDYFIEDVTKKYEK